MIELLIQRQDKKAQVNWNFFLLNPGSYTYACNFQLNGTENDYRLREWFLGQEECKLLFSVPVHFIEDYPSVDYEINRYSVMGFEGKSEGRTKIRASDFVKKLSYSEHIKAECIKYPINFQKALKKREKPLAIERKENRRLESQLRKVELYNTEEFANFDRTLDLHIEKLVGDPSKINPTAALMLQLNALREYLEKAIYLGVERVFIVHGLGKGKLKKAVDDYAKNLEVVKEIKNEYHPKFGFGATEIIFK
ncbi:MAG: hypothetical protein EA409_03215 [Saprospirales bacterium]|nr:MAG: hypothetical protein EA409_03215 [Saprospirales bacterium]